MNTPTSPPTPTNPRGWIGPRGRLVVRTGAWSLLAKAASAANLFVTVPFVLQALGPAQFGAWATLVSLVVFAGFLDFGLGNGTMNLVAAAHGRNDPGEVATAFREGRRTLVRIALGLAAASAIVLPFVPWHQLLGLPADQSGDSRAAVAAVLFSVALGVPLNLANRIQLGLGRGDRAFRWLLLGQLLTLALVVVLSRVHASLAVLTAAAVATPLLAATANTLALLRDPMFAGARNAPRRPEISTRIHREGLLFFVLQLSAAVAFSADLALISALRGPAEAGNFAIVQRLFSIIPLALGFIWTPLWPAYRQALAAGSHDWVERTLRRSLLLAVLLAFGVGLVLVFCFDFITRHCVDRPLHVGFALLAGFLAWCTIDAAGTAIATFLNAASVVRFQVVVATAFAACCIAGKFVAIPRYGIQAVPWITAATFCAIVVVPSAILLPGIIRRALARPY